MTVGCGPDVSSKASDPHLEVIPLLGMSELLNIPVDEAFIGVFRSDFLTSNVDSVEVALICVKDHQSSELGKVTISTIGARQPESRGTMYIAFNSKGGDELTLNQILGIGISTENARRDVPIKNFKIEPSLMSKSSSRLTKNTTVPPGKAQFVWGCYWTSATEQKRVTTVQEILAEKGPFESTEIQDILQAAKSMDDIVVLFATIKAVDE